MFSHGESNARGVAILVKKDFLLIPKDIIRDKQGRYIILHANFEKERILITGLYGPNHDDLQFYEEFFTHVDQTGIDRKIIAGDFNLTLDVLDRSVTTAHKNSSAAKIVRSKLEMMQFIGHMENSEGRYSRVYVATS